MKNSQRIKEILIEMVIESTLPSDMNELDSNIFSFVDDMQDNCFNYWTTEDIYLYGMEQHEAKIEFNDKQLQEIKQLCERRFSAEFGFSWLNIDECITEYLNDLKAV